MTMHVYSLCNALIDFPQIWLLVVQFLRIQGKDLPGIGL